jgi:glycosyltransferase involved in cell wall biosynthesis
VRKEASALGDAGFDVTVMTVATHERFEAYDADILRTAKYRKIVLDHRRRGGLAGARAFYSRLRTWLARHGCRIGIQSPQAFGPTAELGRMAAGFTADLTIVHTEMPFCIGRELLKGGRRVASDFEDWHSRDLLPETRTRRPTSLLIEVERDLLRNSAYSSTTSHALAEALHSAFQGPLPLVFTNSFPLQPDPFPKEPREVPALFWFSQTIGRGRGLELFLSAWRQTSRPSRLSLLGEIDPSYKAKLLHLLPPERRDRLSFLPMTSPDNLPAVIAEHDIGLALELNFPASRSCTITNKILQYLNAGLAIIATDTLGQREVLARAPEAGILVNLFQTGELTARLDGLLADRSQIEAMGRAARRASVETFCWEQEAPRLCAAVELGLKSQIAPLR